MRVISGAVLVWVAAASRMPRTLRVIGGVVIVAGLLLPMFGVERTQAMLGWFSNQGSLFMRAWASMALIFGLFVIYVVNSPRRAPA